MVAGAAWPARARGLAVLVCVLGAGAALARPRSPLGTFGYQSSSIYPRWTWVLVAAGVVAGIVVLVAPAGAAGRSWRAPGAAVAAVAGAVLTGTGMVAFRHWQPASGMGGYGFGEIPQLKNLALALAALAACATLVAGWQLLADEEVRGARWGQGSGLRLLVAAGVALLLPLGLMVGDVDADLQTWGAIGLIYAGPWGAAMAATAWTTRPVTMALVGAVVGCATLAAIGPQMADLLDLSADNRFAATAVILAAISAASLRGQGALPPGRT